MVDTGGGGFSGSSAATAGDFKGSNSLTFGNVSGPGRDNSTMLIVVAAVVAFFIWQKR